MPARTNADALLGELHTLLNQLNALAPVVSSVPLPPGAPKIADVIGVAQLVQNAANALAQENAALRSQLQAFELKAPVVNQGGNAGATAPAPPSNAQSQVYVSAPAAGAIALIAALAGGGIGYAVKAHIDKKKRPGAKELAATEAKRLRAGEEEEEE